MSRQRSIRKKLVAVVMTTTFVALLVSIAIVIAYDLRSYHRALVNDLATQAELVGHMTSAALSFDDARLANENLALLRTSPIVRAAAIYDAQGALFASYSAAGEARPDASDRIARRLVAARPAHDGGELEVRQAIVENGDTVGTVVLRAENRLLARTIDYLMIAAGVTLLAMAIAYLLTRRLGRVITAPIVAITGIAREVVATRDYSRRAPRIGDDEAAELADSFNAMLTEIEGRTRELEDTYSTIVREAQQRTRAQQEVMRLNEQLEQRVDERTLQLALANAELANANEDAKSANQAKSAFLSSMSHELRTPLNSILILGQQLVENADGNLTSRQVDFARTIHGAGTDLLNLISDILDLSKIESGTVSVDAEELFFQNLIDRVALPFRHEAENRGLRFDVRIDEKLGRSIVTDAKRLQQVLKNLLSNAFKFTDTGGVRLDVFAAAEGWSPNHPVLPSASEVVAFTVTDTGIGIPADKQRIIFEAFQQADASTSRRYGGTGLGLAISRELAALLGGEIQLRSAPGEGSTFTLYLPIAYQGPTAPPRPLPQPSQSYTPLPTRAPSAERIPDDRHDINPQDEVLLVVEDDPHYGRIVAGIARDQGLKVLVAVTGAEALELAREFRPTAISLDVFLPDMLGWTVLSRLKQDPLLRHIPVQMLTMDEDRQHGLARGAFDFISKPAASEALAQALGRVVEFSRPRRRKLLVVEDDPAEQMSIRALIGDSDIEIDDAATGEEALTSLQQETYDCVVLDLKLPDMSGFDVLERLRENERARDVPVVVFTGRELSAEEDARLHSMARSIVVKGVESPERLLDETALFLHRVIADLPPEKQRMLERLHSSDEDLIGRTVLLVDDDARNIFALSSLLERRGMRVLTATTGREAIDLVQSNSDIALVLMDIMMPEMDGYQTMQVIRGNPEHRRLPMIALTAKAMKGDREKCLEAGASDYLAKPVNTEQLLSALRMWLHR